MKLGFTGMRRSQAPTFKAPGFNLAGMFNVSGTKTPKVWTMTGDKPASSKAAGFLLSASRRRIAGLITAFVLAGGAAAIRALPEHVRQDILESPAGEFLGFLGFTLVDEDLTADTSSATDPEVEPTAVAPTVTPVVTPTLEGMTLANDPLADDPVAPALSDASTESPASPEVELPEAMPEVASSEATSPEAATSSEAAASSEATVPVAVTLPALPPIPSIVAWEFASASAHETASQETIELAMSAAPGPEISLPEVVVMASESAAVESAATESEELPVAVTLPALPPIPSIAAWEFASASTPATTSGATIELAMSEVPGASEPGTSDMITPEVPLVTMETPIVAIVDRGPAMVYDAGGRDPFRSLLLEEPDYTLCSITDARLVGVAWNDAQMIAMVEDRRGRTWSLRAGDRVQYGRVVSVRPEAAVFDVSVFGKAERKVLELAPKEKESQP